nr:rhodanese-like domain-containing protein [Peptoclostridium litorale]
MAACAKEEPAKEETNGAVNVITTEELSSKLEDDSWVVVDTRLNDAYNGWKLEGVKRGGHIKGAVDFSANWLKVEKENKDSILDEALETKGIAKDRNVVLYDANGKDASAVAEYLAGKGYENVYTYDVKQWAEDESLPMEKYENYKNIVPASVVKDILEGKTPETFEEGKKVKMVEASWGEEETSYAKGHIPTAFHINTDIVEPPPAWMLASDKELAQFALGYGFTKEDTVIVSGAEQMAAYRVALVLKYMGVDDVRVLNGGLGAWTAAGYEAETESHKPEPVSDFGAETPVNPDVIDTIEEAKAGLANPEEFTLVDNRTWEEHIGEISGYSYHDKKGRIPGSVFGYAGKTDSYSLDYYRNIDGTMRNADEILALWDEAGLDTNKHLSFMCGSGWRVAEIYAYSNVMGLENTSVFSDGWIGWSNGGNPIETGEPAK